MTSKYGIPGWNSGCQIADSEIDLKIRNINFLFNNAKLLTTKTLYETEDFNLNINFGNMVFAMCTRDILTIDADLPSGEWSDEEAADFVDILRRFTDFMKERGVELLFKIFRTDKGLHFFLVNRKIRSEDPEAIKIMVALCNDPFYTAFSKISGFCLRIGPKVYRKTKSKSSLYNRVNSELIAKEYNKPKYIGYGTSDPSIEKYLEIKKVLVKFIKGKYKNNFEYMTKSRYIPFIDQFKMCPGEEFFEELIEKASSLYENAFGKSKGSIYKFNFDRNNSIKSATVEIYRQSDITLSYDMFDYVWSITNTRIMTFEFNDITVDFIGELTNKLNNFSVSSGISLLMIHDYKVGSIMVISGYQKPEEIVKLIEHLESLGKEFEQDNHLTLRISPMVSFDVAGNIVLDQLTNQPLVDAIMKNKVIEIGAEDFILKNFLRSISDMHSFMKELYRTNMTRMLTQQMIKDKKEAIFAPDFELIEHIKNQFDSLLLRLELKSPELLTGGTISQMVQSKRYSDIMRYEEIRSCYINVFKIYQQLDMLRNYVIKHLPNNYIYLNGPKYPFVYGQSEYANMIYIATYDVLMLDWDVKLGITKQTGVKILERFIESEMAKPLNGRLFLTTPCFKIYESDNGLHGFLISHRVPHDSDVATKVMIEVCSDINYAAMSKLRGYSIRLSPKIFDGKSYKNSDYIKGQYIQREGVKVGRNQVLYVGDTNNIDNCVEKFVDTIYQTQRYIMSYDSEIIFNAMFNRDKEIINAWGDYLAVQYNTNVRPYCTFDHENALKWASESDDEKRILSIGMKP